MSVGYSTKSYIFDPRPSYPLLSVAKRYWKPDSPCLDDPEALTLIFTHGTSFHKEQWEPIIDDLETYLAKDGGKVKIREIWSIDAPNHGDAAVINEKELQLGYSIFGWEEYARSVQLLLSGNGTGVDVDFSKHRLVGIGHSMGAVSLGLALGYYPKVKFASFIFCEIMIMPERFRAGASDMLASGADKRRDIWPSKEEAYKALKSRGTWKAWDDRILRNYVEFGMLPLPTIDYPDKTEGVTLKCSRIQEAACYRDGVGTMRLYANFENVVKQVPTHLIYGAVNDYLPEEVKTEVVDIAAGGMQNLASFTKVENAGHLVAHMNPRGVAEKIYDALLLTSKPLAKANL